MRSPDPIDTRLQLIAGPVQIDAHSAHGVARIAADGGATVVQWRDKTAPTRGQLESVAALHTACTGSGLALLVNDRTDIALATGCAGVHLGQDDMPLAQARELLGDEAIIGITVRTRDEAHATPLALADYVSIGGVFATASKTDAGTPIGLEGLAALVESVRTRFSGPVIAISGITRASADAVLDTGVDGFAVISAVWGAPEPSAALRSLRKIVDAQPNTRRTQ